VAINYINLHIAKRTMSLRAAYGIVATVSTIWNGRPLLVTWNHRNNAIMFDSCSPGMGLDKEDKEILTGLIKEFYQPKALNKLTIK
jgi:hypothetical protein